MANRKPSESENSVTKVLSNDDLLTDILLRLPIKPLFQFKTVCKQWHSLIGNPNFRRLKNLDIYLKNPEILVDMPDIGNPVTDFQILQSCNGLLLYAETDRDWRKVFYIHNPTTKQTRKLPQNIETPFERAEGVYHKWAFLAFDPQNSPYYKVLCGYGTVMNDISACALEIYSSETRMWRLLDIERDKCFAKVDIFTGVYWNGAINWIGNTDTRLYDGHSIREVGCSLDGMYFNLDEERSGRMPMLPDPNAWTDRRSIVYFGGSYGHLYLIQRRIPGITQFNVYEMDKEYSGWFIRNKFDLNMLDSAIRHPFPINVAPRDLRLYNSKILSFVQGKNDADSFLVLRTPDYARPGYAIRYDVGTGAITKIGDFNLEISYGVRGALQYIESISDV